MNRVCSFVAFVLLLLLTACVGHNPPTGRGATPEEAASNVIPKFHGAPKSFALHGTHATPYGTAVIFATDQARLGYVLTEQRGATWGTSDMNLWVSYPLGSVQRLFVSAHIC